MAYKMKGSPFQRNFGIGSPMKHVGEDSGKHHMNITGESDHYAWQDKPKSKKTTTKLKVEKTKESKISKAKKKIKGHVSDIISTAKDLSKGKDYKGTKMSKWKDWLWKKTINK